MPPLREIVIEAAKLCFQMRRVFVFCFLMVSGMTVAEAVYSYHNPLSSVLYTPFILILVGIFTLFHFQFYRLCLPRNIVAERGFVPSFAFLTLWQLGVMVLTLLLAAGPFSYFLDDRGRSLGLLALPFAFALASGILMALPPLFFHKSIPIVRGIGRATTMGLRASLRHYMLLLLCSIPVSIGLITDELEIFDVPLGAIKPVIEVVDWIDVITLPLQLLASAIVALLGVRVYEKSLDNKGME